MENDQSNPESQGIDEPNLGSLVGKVIDLENAMLMNPSTSVHIEPRHYFARGLYAREISIPRGVVLTGMVHKYQHMCVLSKGEVSVLTDEGIQQIKAPHTLISSPGTKRALFAHEDSVWTNFHATDKTTVQECEDELVVRYHEQLGEAESVTLLKLEDK